MSEIKSHLVSQARRLSNQQNAGQFAIAVAITDLADAIRETGPMPVIPTPMMNDKEEEDV